MNPEETLCLHKPNSNDKNDDYKLRGSDDGKIEIFHYCVYFKFVTVILFLAISQNFTNIERVVFELCAKVCE